MKAELSREQFVELVRSRGFDLTPAEIDEYFLIWTEHLSKLLERLRLRMPGGLP